MSKSGKKLLKICYIKYIRCIFVLMSQPLIIEALRKQLLAKDAIIIEKDAA